jgi:hypothetical protein
MMRGIGNEWEKRLRRRGDEKLGNGQNLVVVHRRSWKRKRGLRGEG